jgi:hypothetical protein
MVKAAEFVGDVERGVLGGEIPGSGGSGSAQGVEIFEGEDGLIEDKAELAGSFVRDGFECEGLSRRGEFLFKTGDGVVGDATGDDELEITKVGGDVKGEPMGSDAPGDMDADGRDLSFALVNLGLRFGTWLGRGWVEAAPDAGEAGNSSGGDAPGGAQADEGFFHFANEIDGAHAAPTGVFEGAQVEDGVADELSRAMVGDIATAIDLVQGYAAGGEEGIGGEDIGAFGVAAQGEDGRVFEEKQHILKATGYDVRGDLGLEAEGFVVVDAAEIEDLNHGYLDCRDGGREPRMARLQLSVRA